MSSIKYSRLPSHIGPRKYKFPALEGPGYFTYDAQPGKYSSMFTYSRMATAEYSAPSDSNAATLLSIESQPVHEQIGVYGDQSHAGNYAGGQCDLDGAHVNKIPTSCFRLNVFRL